jgi:hypothetical protein
MKRGLKVTWPEEVCHALAPVDPGFAAAIVPASPEDMTQLASLINSEIPQDYARFLSMMGAYDGGLFYEERCDTRISTVIAYCESQKAAGRVLDAARFIPFGLGADFGGFCLTGADQGPHPPVALFEGPEPEEIVFPSLPAMLFAKAFFIEMAATGRKIFIRGIAGETADSLVEKLLLAGFEREWFSFGKRTYLRQGRMLAAVATDRPQRPTMETGGRDEASLAGAFAALKEIVRSFEPRELVQKKLPEIREIHRQIGWL